MSLCIVWITTTIEGINPSGCRLQKHWFKISSAVDGSQLILTIVSLWSSTMVARNSALLFCRLQSPRDVLFYWRILPYEHWTIYSINWKKLMFHFSVAELTACPLPCRKTIHMSILSRRLTMFTVQRQRMATPLSFRMHFPRDPWGIISKTGYL